MTVEFIRRSNHIAAVLAAAALLFAAQGARGANYGEVSVAVEPQLMGNTVHGYVAPVRLSKYENTVSVFGGYCAACVIL